MNRRAMLKSIAIAGAASASRPLLFGQALNGSSGNERVVTYLESLARTDGGYGWEGQEHSHLMPTFFIIGCYRLLKRTPPRKAQLAEFVRSHHPAVLKKLEQERRIFEWQQVQALTWLGEDASELKTRILGWKQPLAYMKQYERHGYPLFSSEMGVILSRFLLGEPAKDLPEPFVTYLDSRRRSNGSFNNTPASDGSDGHVLSTWWGLQAIEVLGRARERSTETIAWLRSCQLPSGGFTLAPKPEFGGVEDVAYTWAATRALKPLGVAPANQQAAETWLMSLRNSDGGFADRPGWFSNPMATYYALDALDALNALKDLPAAQSKPAKTKTSLSPDLRVFSIQLEAHGQGSPSEAVDLARALRIQLWGAKNAKPEWLARAQALADQQNAGVKFFVSNEEYGTWVDVPGLGTYSHTSDVVAPKAAGIGPPLAGKDAASWKEFRERRLSPLEKAGGRLIWQFGENEELVRMFLDDSVERGGYAAISTYHFGNPDFTNSEPFLHRWRGQIPFVALQDSHGPEPWWFADMTTGFRTLFIAKEPTWEGWLEALKQNWVVPVRHDQWSGGKTWMHAASQEVREFVRARERDWRWWNNPEIQRPLISIVAVRSQDQFETARPDKGVTLRIRCAWQNTPQGLLKQPITELAKLIVDRAEVVPELVSKARPNGLYDEHYHVLHLPEIAAGKHTAIAVARVVETRSEVRRTVEFSA
jgi:hypothetical protein